MCFSNNGAPVSAHLQTKMVESHLAIGWPSWEQPGLEEKWNSKMYR